MANKRSKLVSSITQLLYDAGVSAKSINAINERNVTLSMKQLARINKSLKNVMSHESFTLNEIHRAAKPGWRK